MIDASNPDCDWADGCMDGNSILCLRRPVTTAQMTPPAQDGRARICDILASFGR